LRFVSSFLLLPSLVLAPGSPRCLHFPRDPNRAAAPNPQRPPLALGHGANPTFSFFPRFGHGRGIPPQGASTHAPPPRVRAV